MRSNKDCADVGVFEFCARLLRAWPTRAGTQTVKIRRDGGTGSSTRAAARTRAATPARSPLQARNPNGSHGTVITFSTATDRLALAVAVFSAGVLGFEAFGPAHLDAPGVRTALETAIGLCALVGVSLLALVLHHRRRLSDLLLLIALATLALADLSFVGLPVFRGANVVVEGSVAQSIWAVAVSTALAAAALAPSATLVARRRRLLPVIAGAVALVALIAVVAGRHWAPDTLPEANLGNVGDPLLITAQLLSSGVLIVAGTMFAAQAGSRDRDAGLLAGAAFLLAAARLECVAMPTVSAHWVTPGVGMRFAAYGLLLVVAFRREEKSRQEERWAAVTTERQRIARDLHDGIAQDLAVIAVHGPQFASQLGADHPVVIAAQRALATSRGAMVDLSASTAPNTGAALRQVADELEGRFSVRVNVTVKPEGGPAGGGDLDPAEREEVVRITREAIANAIRHGAARRIDVELDYGGPELLRVCDDGCGIDASPARSGSGFGLPTMRARAEAIGGRLVTRRRVDGGTEIMVRVL